MTEPDEDSGETATVRYYTYHGYSMKDELIGGTGLSTGYVTVCRGVEAYGDAKSINGVVLDLAGYGSKAVSIFNSALTLYRAYTDITGTAPISGSYEDFIQVKLSYDVWTKYTYADLGYGDGYRLGAVTQKIRLIDIEILQYYADCNGGREVAVCNVLNKTAVTADFKNPAPTAIASISMPYVEKISAKLYRHPIVF